MSKIILPALFVATCLSTTMAATCSAVGWMRDNSVMVEGPLAAWNGVELFNANGDQIGEMNCDDDCPGACTDFAWIDGDGLETSFAWAASCNINTFTECHGSYGDQTHVDGEEPTSGTDFYGIGITASSQCKVEFEC
ncbi:hypothetical protein BDV59DRAFT_212012 [Aspergillus ambiguus]|uniref:uncharacterized protein n=1 Tax=Aspergillus ambiguus TaxID=176160 RepID=UPI003CCDAFDA